MKRILILLFLALSLTSLGQSGTYYFYGLLDFEKFEKNPKGAPQDLISQIEGTIVISEHTDSLTFTFNRFNALSPETKYRETTIKGYGPSKWSTQLYDDGSIHSTKEYYIGSDEFLVVSINDELTETEYGEQYEMMINWNGKTYKLMAPLSVNQYIKMKKQSSED
jgi:hypothetical protein